MAKARCFIFLLAFFFGFASLAYPQQAFQTIREIRRLSAADAQEKRSVVIQAQVTFVDPAYSFCFVSDGTEGIFVHGIKPGNLQQGDRIQIRGTTDFEIHPFIQSTGFEILASQASLPKPQRIAPGSLADAANDCRWVQAELVFKQATILPDRVILIAEKEGKSFFVNLTRCEMMTPREAARLVGKKTTVTGSMGYFIDVPPFYQPGDQKKPTVLGFQLFVQKPDQIQVKERAVDKALPFYNVRLSRARQFKYPCFGIEFNGQITLLQKGYCIIQSGNQAIRVRLSNCRELQVGHTVTCLAWQETGTQFSAAVMRPNYFISHLVDAKPVDLSSDQLEELTHQRVSAVGKLKTHSDFRGIEVLEIQSGSRTIPVEIVSRESFQDRFDPASIKRLKVSGVLLPAEDGTDGYRIVVSRLDDIEVQQRALRFPFGILAILVGIFLLAILVGLIIVKTLRKSVRDKTHRLDAINAQMRLSYDSINDGIVATDLQDKIIASNATIRKMFGEQVCDGEKAEQFFSALRSMLDESEGAKFLEFFESERDPSGPIELITKSESPQYLTVERSLIRDPNVADEWLGKLWLIRDVTDQRVLQASLLQAQKMEAIGTFTGGIAHDFNNLLTPIALNLAMIRSEIQDKAPDLDDEVECCEEAIFRAAGVVRQLLTFSQNKPLRLTSCCVNEEIYQLKSLLRYVYDSSITAEFNFGDDLPRVEIDKTLFEQVLVNLFLNARDAMPGGGKIKLTTSVDRHLGEQMVVISVEDNGSGIPEDLHSRIFEPFFTTKDSGKGSGLGLAVSYAAVKRHGGELSFNTWPGQGTEFRITLPVPRAAGSRVSPSHPANFSSYQFSGKVLLIDDEAIVRNSTAKALKSFGYEVIEAPSGKTGLQLFGEQFGNFECVLLDLKMPDMDGWQVLREIKEMDSQVPVILCSGFISHNRFQENVETMFADAILEKPFSIQELGAVLDEVMNASGVR